jgi:uncharacterized protein YyaL (SSP411 family)
VAERYRIFAGTYGIAAVHFFEPHTQVVIIGSDEKADQLCRIATAQFALNQAVIKLTENEVAAQNLPSALAETIPNLPALRDRKTVGVVCSGFACQPPVTDPDQLSRLLREQRTKSH